MTWNASARTISAKRTRSERVRTSVKVLLFELLSEHFQPAEIHQRSFNLLPLLTNHNEWNDDPTQAHVHITNDFLSVHSTPLIVRWNYITLNMADDDLTGLDCGVCMCVCVSELTFTHKMSCLFPVSCCFSRLCWRTSDVMVCVRTRLTLLSHFLSSMSSHVTERHLEQPIINQRAADTHWTWKLLIMHTPSHYSSCNDSNISSIIWFQLTCVLQHYFFMVFMNFGDPLTSWSAIIR